MTTTITDKTLTSSAYVLIAENVASVLLQIKDPDPARIVIATSLPTVDVVDGIVLSRDGLAEIAMNELDPTDKIYGKAIGGDTTIGGFTVAAA